MHWKSDCPAKRKQNDRTGEAFIGITQSSANGKILDWILDTGANVHKSYKEEWFSDYVKFNKLMAVNIGDGKHIPALGCRNINVLPCGVVGST